MDPATIPEAVARLAGQRAEDYLSPHHVEATERLVRLFDRARLRQRVTMSYDPARVGRSGTLQQGEIADSAADARKRLATLARAMPRECWGVLVDVCALDHGLQDIETQRRWPRRSAKLVLRIALEHLSGLFGLNAEARGYDSGAARIWLPERPPMFPVEGN